MTTLVHGEEATRKAEKISRALFYGELLELEEDEIEQGFNDVPSHTMEEPELGLIDLLAQAGISSSKRQAREDIKNGAVYINGERCTQLDRRYCLRRSRSRGATVHAGICPSQRWR